MREDLDVPQMNVSRIRVDGNIAGAIVAVATVAICLVGIPALSFLVVAAAVLGGGVALALRRLRGE